MCLYVCMCLYASVYLVCICTHVYVSCVHVWACFACICVCVFCYHLNVDFNVFGCAFGVHVLMHVNFVCLYDLAFVCPCSFVVCTCVCVNVYVYDFICLCVYAGECVCI